MEEYNYCDEMKDQYKIEELESETLKYRINKFMYACGMDLTESSWEKDISTTRLPYIYKKMDDEAINYDVRFARSYDREKGKCFILIGKYNDLNLMFINYFDKDKRKNRVNEIPFHILLSKNYGAAYQLEIRSTSSTHAKFFVKKNIPFDMLPNVVVFQADVKDFGQVLKLVKSFVHNPALVFKIYDAQINSKEVVLTNKDLSSALVVDENLDKPLSGVQKVIKKIIK